MLRLSLTGLAPARRAWRLALTAAVLAAARPGSAQPSRPPRDHAAPRGDACVVTGTPAELGVTVKVSGTSPLQLRPRGVRAGVQLPASLDAPAAVVVEGAISFRGTTADAPVALATVTHLAGGVVRALPTYPLTNLVTDGRDALATVDLGGVMVRGVTVPCAALTLDPPLPPRVALTPVTTQAAARAPASTGPLPTMLDARPSVLTLHERPGGGGAKAQLENRYRALLSFRLLARSGGWTLIAWDAVGGGGVAGWVRDAQLASTVGAPGHGSWMPRVARGPTTGFGVRVGGYAGPATLAAGAGVYAGVDGRPGGVRWGEVRDARAPFAVIVEPGEAWARITAAPGLTGLIDTWVPRSAVRLPPGVRVAP